MHRVLVVVEGYTERAFLQHVVVAHLAQRGVSLQPKVVGTPGKKGGARRSLDGVRKEIVSLLRQEARATVTTLFDYYALPDAWPGVEQAKRGNVASRADVVEKAWLEDVVRQFDPSGGQVRFLPYVQMHELEALLFASPQVMADVFEKPQLAAVFQNIVTASGGCERINDGPQTAPSKRIEAIFPRYRKGSGEQAHAPLIAARTGLPAIRQACPRFDAWLTKLETW